MNLELSARYEAEHMDPLLVSMCQESLRIYISRHFTSLPLGLRRIENKMHLGCPRRKSLRLCWPCWNMGAGKY